MTLVFKVLGRPQPAGSKRAFPNKKTGRIIITDDAKGSRPWKQEVAGAAHHALLNTGDRTLFTGPLEVTLHFVLTRPKGHYGSGRNAHVLRAGAPAWPTVKPDIDKLSRAILDSLTGVVWRDDAQVVRKCATKSYGHPEGVEVAVRPLLAPVGSLLEDAA